MSLTKIGSIGINTGIQLAGVTTVATLHVGSGVTLSSDGDVFATGISTFSEDIKVGSGVTVSPDGNIFATGVCTATSFVGDGANLTNVDVVSDTSPQLGGNLDVNTKNIVFGDSGGATDDRLTFGAGTDLQIYHDSNHSYINNTGTGHLYIIDAGIVKIQSESFKVDNSDGTKQVIKANPDAGLEIYYNNSKKFETTSSGITVTGAVNASSVTLGDDNKAYFGTGNDLAIYHDGSNSYILNTTNNLIIKDLTDAVYIQAPSIIFNDETTNENIARFISDGAVELYYDHSKKFHTRSDGCQVTGVLKTGDDGDTSALIVGASDDLKIYHDGTHSYLANSTGNLYVNAPNFLHLGVSNGGEKYLTATENGAVDLYYDGTKHFETKTNGVKIDSGGDTILEMHTSNSTAHSRIQFSNDNGDNRGGIWYSAGDIMEFRTASAERYRIHNTGKHSWNNTTFPYSETFHFYNGTDNSNFSIYQNSAGDFTNLIMRHGRGGLAGYSGKQISFRGNDGTEEGSIVTGTTSTAFNTSSDYRLKENEVLISDGITRLKQLKPYRFNFKKDPSVTVDGFFAHEVTSVVPQAVTGDKDEVYTEENAHDGFNAGDIRVQSLDYGKLTPLLTAALQEAITEIETLKAKVAALEG